MNWTTEVSKWIRGVYSSEAHVFSKYITSCILHRKFQTTLFLCLPWKQGGRGEWKYKWFLGRPACSPLTLPTELS